MKEDNRIIAKRASDRLSLEEIEKRVCNIFEFKDYERPLNVFLYTNGNVEIPYDDVHDGIMDVFFVVDMEDKPNALAYILGERNDFNDQEKEDANIMRIVDGSKKKVNLTNLEDILKFFGAKKPFKGKCEEKLSKQGEEAYELLVDLLTTLESWGVFADKNLGVVDSLDNITREILELGY